MRFRAKRETDLFPNRESWLRLVTALGVEISDSEESGFGVALWQEVPGHELAGRSSGIGGVHPGLIDLEESTEYSGLDFPRYQYQLGRIDNYPVCYLKSTPEWSRLKAAILRFTSLLCDKNVFT